MVEARYRGQKVVVVSPDYAEHTKFADHWLAAQPGSDGALAMAMGHVILKEFYVERETPYFRDYARRFTDLPLLVTLRDATARTCPDRLLRASDLAASTPTQEHADWKMVVLDERTGEPAVPNGSVGHRYAASDEGRWNLQLGRDRARADATRPRARAGCGRPAALRRRPARGWRDRASGRAGNPDRRALSDDGARLGDGAIWRRAGGTAGRLAFRI